MKKIGLAVLFATMAARTAFCATYYVDVNHSSGSDSNPGSEALPWRTITKAAATLAAGDTALVKSGTYYHARTDFTRYLPVLNPANSGAPGNPIIFKAYPGHAPVITYAPNVNGGGPLIGAYLRSWITWDGFTVQEVAANTVADTGPIVVYGDEGRLADHVVVQNCDVRGVPVQYGFRDNHNGVRLAWVSNALIRGNKIHGLGDSGNGWNDAAVMTYGMINSVIENNEIYDSNTGVFLKGFYTLPNDNNQFRFNVVRNVGVGVRTSYTYNTKIYQNIIRDVGTAIQFAEVCRWESATGTYCAPGYDLTSNRQAYNNTIYNAESGLEASEVNDRFIGGGMTWFNNLIASTRYPVLVQQWASAVPGEDLEGRYSTDRNGFFNFTGFKARESEYGFSQWQAIGKDVNSIAADPQFVNAAAGDFHLKAGSPMAGKGAYVTGLEVIGIGGPVQTPDTAAPAAPRGLVLAL